jgi:hypothetical protein
LFALSGLSVDSWNGSVRAIRTSVSPITVCVALALSGCAPRYVIDSRPLEAQLRARPAPSFTQADIDQFKLDHSKSVRVSRLPRGCAPLAPPTRAMLDQRVYFVEGVIRAQINPRGQVVEVTATDVVPKELSDAVLATFSMALTTPPCALPPTGQLLTIEIPFVLKLE